MTKKLYVSSTVQKALLTNILIPEMKDGFWQNHRPADHAKQWEDVHIIVTDSEKLGPVDWEIPRLYNFVNPDFIKPNEERLVKCAQDAKSSSNFRSVKKELIELSRIVGGRLTDKNGIPTKANRGTNKPGSTVQETVKKAKDTVKKAGATAKKTAVKKGTTITKKGGTVVKRTPVVKAEAEGETSQLPPELQQIAEQIKPTGEEVKPETAENQTQPIEGTAQTEGVSEDEIAEAAKIVQDQAAEGDLVTEQVTTITTTTVVHQEPAHEVQGEAPAAEQKTGE